MNRLVYQILKAKPTQREAKSFLSKLHLISVFYCQHIHDICHIQEFLKMGMTPICLLEPKKTLHDTLNDLFRFVEPGGIPMYPGFSTTNNRLVLDSRLFSIIESKQIPVLSCTALYDNKLEIISPLDCVSSLAQSIPNLDKFIIYNNSGGITINDQHISFINLSLFEHDDQRIEMMKQVLHQTPNCTGIISSHSSSQFLPTLITDKIKSTDTNIVSCNSIPPTLVRKGVQLKTFTKLQHVNLIKLSELLESSFQKKLDSSYFSNLDSLLHSITIAGDFDGAMILLKPNNTIYLDKFAIKPESQGQGISDILWRELCTYENVFWRSRIENPVNKWYYDKSNGHVRLGKWYFFWFGKVDLESCIQIVRSLPATFK